MKIRDQLVSSREKTYGEGNPCTSITVHETANTSRGADAQAHANLQSSGNVRQASWHITVDDKRAIRSFPDTVKCWHAGTEKGNATSIGVEICVNSDGNYEKALANAAEVVKILRKKHGLGRGAMKQHEEWSGKNCPTKLRASGRWPEFVASTDPDSTTPPPVETETSMGMTSPIEGYTSSGYGRRGSGFHAGHDIATGGQRRPVYAAYAGTIERIVRGRKHGQPAYSGKVLASGRSGNGVIVRNPDGERQLYGHVDVLSSLRVGQRVKQGQLLGYVDLSGNTTGLHLHFETWNANRSTRNPLVDFRAHGIKPGSKPKGTSSGESKPGKSKGKSGGGNLRVDGDFGPLTVKALQRLLSNKKWNAYYSGRIDGDFGPMTRRAYQTFLKKWKNARTYSGRIDGDFGPMSKRAEQQWLAKRGYYKGRIDAIRGPVTIKALQRCLNKNV